jgi:hypothetical protein
VKISTVLCPEKFTSAAFSKTDRQSLPPSSCPASCSPSTSSSGMAQSGLNASDLTRDQSYKSFLIVICALGTKTSACQEQILSVAELSSASFQ